ncbi:MAG TPA: extracellular solute-binding protein, partial [Limnochordales bacterium]
SWDDLIPAFREVTGETYLPLYAGILGWAVNEQMLNSMGLPIPRTWKDLTAPVYRGLIAMPNPNTSGTGYTMLATILQIYGEDEGWKLLRDLHFNVAQYTRAGAEPGLLAGRGEVAIGVTFMHDALHQAIQGFPVSVKAPADGTGFEIGGLSLVRNGPNREGAIRFIEWALSPEAQVLAAQRGESYQLPTNVNTPLDPRSPRFSDVRVIPYDFEHWGDPAVREAVVGRWTNEVYPIPRPRN